MYHLSDNLKTNVGFLERTLFLSILLVMHEKSLADDVSFILIEFRNAQKCTIQTENIQLAHLGL